MPEHACVYIVRIEVFYFEIRRQSDMVVSKGGINLC
jgi:hypothetical protein